MRWVIAAVLTAFALWCLVVLSATLSAAQVAVPAVDSGAAWLKYTPQDWYFLICLSGIAIYLRRSQMIHEKIATLLPIIVAMIYGVEQVRESNGYAVVTLLMFKGAVMAFGAILAQQAATAILDKLSPSKELNAAVAGISDAAATKVAMDAGAVPTVVVQANPEVKKP